MIGEFIFRTLILAFGYAYPAFQCFKTIEKNKVGIQELRFWCQYWTIIAVLTVVEIFLDIFISWLPLYRVIKLATYIYLWHPNTKGSSYVYETFLQPCVARHETEIDRMIAEVKERVWSFVMSYWYNCADSSSKKILNIFQLMLSQFMILSQADAPTKTTVAETNEAPSPTPPSTPAGIFKRNNSQKQRPPPPSPGRGLANKPDSWNKTKLHNQTQSIHDEDTSHPDSEESDQDLLAARVKLRPVKSGKAA